MRIPTAPFYLIWLLIQIIFFNFGIYFTTGDSPNFIGTVFLVLFFHVAVTLPVMSIMGHYKNENS